MERACMLRAHWNAPAAQGPCPLARLLPNSPCAALLRAQEVSPGAPSPTTACKNKLHKSFRIAKLQVGCAANGANAVRCLSFWAAAGGALPLHWNQLCGHAACGTARALSCQAPCVARTHTRTLTQPPCMACHSTQVNRDLEVFIREARAQAEAAAAAAETAGAAEAAAGVCGDEAQAGALAAAAAGEDDAGSLERVLLIAERCLEEPVEAFRDSIQLIVDQLEVRGRDVGEARSRQRGQGLD